jgi:hypothetical protein
MQFCKSADLRAFIMSDSIGSNLNVVYDAVAFVCFSVLPSSVVFGNIKMSHDTAVYRLLRLLDFFVAIFLSNERPYRFVVVPQTIGA